MIQLSQQYIYVINSNARYNSFCGICQNKVTHIISIHSVFAFYNLIGFFLATVNSSFTDTISNYNTLRGMHLEQSNTTLIMGAMLKMNGGDGMVVLYSTNTSIANILASNNSEYGIRIMKSISVFCCNITAIGSKMYGLYISSTYNIRISSCLLNNNEMCGLGLDGTVLAYVAHTSAHNNLIYGISLSNTTPHILPTSQQHTITMECIYITKALGTVLKSTVIEHSGKVGIS